MKIGKYYIIENTKVYDNPLIRVKCISKNGDLYTCRRVLLLYFVMVTTYRYEGSYTPLYQRVLNFFSNAKQNNNDNSEEHH